MSENSSARKKDTSFDMKAYAEGRNEKKQKKRVEQSYNEAIDSTLRGTDFDEATQKKLREFLSNPWVKAEVVKETLKAEGDDEGVARLLKHVLENKEDLERAIAEKQKSINSLKGKKVYWNSQLSKLNGSDGNLGQKIKQIGDRIKLLERQIRGAEKAPLNLKFPAFKKEQAANTDTEVPPPIPERLDTEQLTELPAENIIPSSDFADVEKVVPWNELNDALNEPENDRGAKLRDVEAALSREEMEELLGKPDGTEKENGVAETVVKKGRVTDRIKSIFKTSKEKEREAILAAPYEDNPSRPRTEAEEALSGQRTYRSPLKETRADMSGTISYRAKRLDGNIDGESMRSTQEEMDTLADEHREKFGDDETVTPWMKLHEVLKDPEGSEKQTDSVNTHLDQFFASEDPYEGQMVKDEEFGQSVDGHANDPSVIRLAKELGDPAYTPQTIGFEYAMFRGIPEENRTDHGLPATWEEVVNPKIGFFDRLTGGKNRARKALLDKINALQGIYVDTGRNGAKVVSSAAEKSKNAMNDSFDRSNQPKGLV